MQVLPPQICKHLVLSCSLSTTSHTLVTLKAVLSLRSCLHGWCAAVPYLPGMQSGSVLPRHCRAALSQHLSSWLALHHHKRAMRKFLPCALKQNAAMDTVLSLQLMHAQSATPELCCSTLTGIVF